MDESVVVPKPVDSESVKGELPNITSLSAEEESKILTRMRQVFDSYFCRYIKTNSTVFSQYHDNYCSNTAQLYNKDEILEAIRTNKEYSVQINEVQYEIYCFLCKAQKKFLQDIKVDNILYKWIAWENSVTKADYLCKYRNRNNLLIEKFQKGVEFVYDDGTQYRIELVSYEHKTFNIKRKDKDTYTNIFNGYVDYKTLSNANIYTKIPKNIKYELTRLTQSTSKDNAIRSYMQGCEDTKKAKKAKEPDSTPDLSTLIYTVYKLYSRKIKHIESINDCQNNDRTKFGSFAKPDTIITNNRNKCENENEYILDRQRFKQNDSQFIEYLNGVINTHNTLLSNVFKNDKDQQTVFIHNNEHVSLIRQITELQKRMNPSFLSRIFTRGGKKRNTKNRQPRKSIKLKRRLSKHRFRKTKSIHE